MNHKNHEIPKISRQNYENDEKLFIPLQNHINYEIPKISSQNNENQES